MVMTTFKSPFHKSKFFAVSLATATAICLSVPKPVHAGNGGYVAGAIIGGIATAIIAAEAAKAAARQSAGQPGSRHIGARRKMAPENANASVANNSGDPFAGAVPTRIKRED
jgi:hypothetical protein